ncbi:MAG: DUF493 family protein [Alkalimonas sp.]|uniref:UPF0250 protein Q3O59_12465 n=1 Tax=Alkalimonas delamerensis TaxID=265981 RepID=A0ABT9GSB0_9GAMM|nr:DUF493 family protein YbeD [Alkalimonas delamerensis]MCC5852449.1 DUF493 family protein [Alkalimonas sp.]MDP4529834.1 DUF493 family protein YbeD [Alkalimonas delamerensis]
MVTPVKNTNFDALLEFPCQVHFKVMGVAHERLVDDIIEVLQQHAAPADYSPSIQPSAKGNYHSVRIAVQVEDKTHMELLYTELSRLELVRYVL